MNILGIDAGSSSVKAAVLRNGRIAGRLVRCAFPTRFEGVRAEVEPRAILQAIAQAISELGAAARRVDVIALSVMAPSWIAMDSAGRPLTPIVTHQDRRSVDAARALEARLGVQRLLALNGNRPFPGGISSSTFAWFVQHEPELMAKADLVGHLNTYLHRQMTGARVTDPSNASYMGLYSVLDMGGWNLELCEAAGASPRVLPDILPANAIGGHITAQAALDLGLTAGTPMLTGLMDTAAALLLVGAKIGQLINVCGSTDVLGVVTDHPRPDERLLTRALGVGRKWMSVSTIAAAGSAFAWAKEQLFADLSEEAFRRLMQKLARRPLPSTVRFEPYLAGDRMSIEQRQGAFTGLTLASTREQMLGAMIEALAAASAARIPLLQAGGLKILRTVLVSGGVQGGLNKVLHRDWPGQWVFRTEIEATLRGLGTMKPVKV